MTFPIRSKMPMAAYLASPRAARWQLVIPTRRAQSNTRGGGARFRTVCAARRTPRRGFALLGWLLGPLPLDLLHVSISGRGAADLPGFPSKKAMTMAVCKQCGEEAETLVAVKVAGKSKKMCEDCADRAREEAEVAEQSEAVVQNMMGFKGRR